MTCFVPGVVLNYLICIIFFNLHNNPLKQYSNEKLKAREVK